MSGTALAALAAGAGGALGRAAASLDGARAEGRLGHAYLLVGPSGAGKRTLASALAKDILGFIRSDGTHPDLTLLAPEEGKREIGIDLVRAACAEMSLAPLEAPGRMALLHGADLLGEEAANALLKTLEEPPPGGVLVLTTARPEAVLPTIRSRCMALRLPPRAPGAGSPAAPSGGKEDPLAALARAGEALLEPSAGRVGRGFPPPGQERALDPFERAARAYASALEIASEGEDGERPALEKRRRAVLALLDGADARLALRVRERSRTGLSLAAEEAALERLALAARCIEANASPELVLEVLSLDLSEIAGSLGDLCDRGRNGGPPHG